MTAPCSPRYSACPRQPEKDSWVSLKYAILGFLIDKPLHGYRLKEVLSPGLSRKQLMNDGILYPLLSRMKKEGLIRKKVKARAGILSRHVYYPTSKGRKSFKEWLKNDENENDAITYDFFLGHPFLYKTMFFKRLTKPEIQLKLKVQKTATNEKLENFYRIRKGMVERSVDPYRIAILDLGIAQQRAKNRWLNALLTKIRGKKAKRRRHVR